MTDRDAGGLRTDRRSPPPGFWTLWSLRDLRARWVQVGAIALVIALGVGTYAGLSSTAVWRKDSYDASYATTDAHDLLVTTAEGTTADRQQLLDALGRMEHPEWLSGVTTSLAVPVQVDASTGGETILVPGLLVGRELGGAGAAIDRLAVTGGRSIRPEDTATVLLDGRFVAARDLPTTGRLRLGGTGQGGTEVQYVGTALTPRYFILDQRHGGVLGAAGYAVLYGSLPWVQQFADQPGRVNELGITLADGVDVHAARSEVAAALGGADGTGTDGTADAGAAVTVVPLVEEATYRTLYDDIDNDQVLYTIFAGLILAGAAFAAFNLTGRIVEAQRREIGIGMSLGLPPRFLAVRPLLVALEVALLGSAMGVVVGMLMSRAMGGLLESYFPMPVWETTLPAGVFVRGALLGVVLVLGASVWPVRRAVRVPPIEAIRTGPRRTASSGWTRFAQRVPLPGGSLAQMPLRDVLRAPRRTVLTALGIAAMVATLIAVIGMVDSFSATIDQGEAAIVGGAPDRITVRMSDFTVAADPRVEAVAAVPGVSSASDGLRIGGTVSNAGRSVDVLLDVIDLSGKGVWEPELRSGSLHSDEPALVLSRKAADDLGVHVGDTVRFRHPLRQGLGYRWVTSSVRVGAVNANPYRFLAYMDRSHAGLFDLAGVVNQVDVRLDPGADRDQVRRALFDLPGVSSVQPVTESVALIRDALGQFVEILTLVEVAVLLLAVLIAFNSSSIGADERRREHATMFAFGVPSRRVLAMAMAESAMVGVLATVVGVLAGLGLLTWIVRALIPDTLPEVWFDISVAPSTFLTAGLLGVVAVSLAPVLTLRKLRRMDIPATLRVVE